MTARSHIDDVLVHWDGLSWVPDDPSAIIPGCRCNACGKTYCVDLVVPDELWERIKPDGKPVGAGLLCPSCIGTRIERDSRGYAAYHLARSRGDHGTPTE